MNIILFLLRVLNAEGAGGGGMSGDSRITEGGIMRITESGNQRVLD